MKFITREITTYTYTFGRIDLANGQATDLVKFTTVTPMGMRGVNSFSKEHDGVLLLHTAEETKKYSLPVDEFVTACENYAAGVDTGYYETDDTAD